MDMESKENIKLQFRRKYGEIFIENEIISIECTFCSWKLYQSEPHQTETIWTEFTKHLEEDHSSNEQYLKDISDEEGMIKEENIKSEFAEVLPDIVAIEHNYESLTRIQEENFSDSSNSKFEEIQSTEEVQVTTDKMNSKLRKLQCKICLISYDNHRLLIRHMRGVHKIFSSLQFEPLNDGKYHCTVCIEAVFNKAIFLSNHIKTRHENYYKQLLTIQHNELIESEILKKKDTMYTKKKIQYPKNFGLSNDGLWHCPKCDATRKTQERIKVHFKESHVKDNTCHICGKQVTTQASLEQHILTHTGEKTLQCPYCDKAFLYRSVYTGHVRIHEGDKRYKCGYCDKRFIQRTEQKIHEKRMHIKKHSIQCEVCGKGFYRSADLISHMRRHTGERPFKCEVCSKSFFDNKLLKDHMVTHSNEKPFECEICSTKFSRKRNLATHKLIHSSIKNYHCDLCGESFTQNAGLYSHKKSSHNDLNP